MSLPKGCTPGPWFVLTAPNTGGSPCESSFATHVMVNPRSDWSPVSFLFHTRHKTHTEGYRTWRAEGPGVLSRPITNGHHPDALLFAASPELYAALQEALPVLIASGNQGAVIMAQRALARAEGETWAISVHPQQRRQEVIEEAEAAHLAKARGEATR